MAQYGATWTASRLPFFGYSSPERFWWPTISRMSVLRRLVLMTMGGESAAHAFSDGS